MIWIEFAIVLACIFLGARIGGAGLGTMAAFGLAIFVFGFGAKPGSLPIDVIFIIVAVISAAAAMQAAGGLDLLVAIASRLLRQRPQSITYVALADDFAQKALALSATDATTTLDRLFDLRRQQLELDQRFRPRFAAVLSPQKVLLVYELNAIFDAVVSYDLAGMLPLAKE